MKVKLLAILLLVCAAKGHTQAQPIEKHRLQAAFALNFARFTEWPVETFATEEAPFLVCVMGDKALANAFDPLAKKTVGSRPVEVTISERIDKPENCQLIFVQRTDRRELGRLFVAIADSPVLTVGEMSGFTDTGGVINLVTEQEKMTFVVNLNNARRANIKLSSRLLKLANQIDE